MLYTTVLGLVPWKQPEMQILVPVFTEELPSGETWNGTREAQQDRPRCGFTWSYGSFWSMNYTIKLSYPEVRGLAISVYYWYWATFGKGSNLGISRQVLSHRLRTILRRMQLGALNNPSSEQLGDLLQSSQVFAYTIHSMKKQQPLLLCYCLKTCPNIVVFKPYLGNLPIHSYPHHPSPSWVSTLFPSLTLYALIILFGIILGRVFALPRLSKESLFKEKLWMSLP